MSNPTLNHETTSNSTETIPTTTFNTTPILSQKTTPTETKETKETMFEGDVIQLKVQDKDYYGEILSINENGTLDVSCIQPTPKQEGRIWEFVADNEW